MLRALGVEVVTDRHQPHAIDALRAAIGGDVDMVADLVGDGVLAASLEILTEGGRAVSIVELAGDLDKAIDRNVTLHGLLVRPGRQSLAALAALVDAGRLHPVVDEVVELADAPRAHRRVESGSGQGKVVIVMNRSSV